VIEITGHVLSNLDEFKLRLGHLSLVCEIAKFQGGTAFRLERDLIERLTRPVDIEESDTTTIGRYLEAKKLCAEDGKELPGKKKKFRYPEITYRKTDGGGYRVFRSQESPSLPTIWFQDFCLAQPGVRSRTGAITAGGKSGSKTGISHVIDWATELELINKSGSPSPIASIIADEVRNQADSGGSNPYILGPEKLALGYVYVRSDFDVFAQLIRNLAKESGTILKSDARTIFVNVVEQLTQKAENDPNLTNRRSRPIYTLWRDVEKAGKRARKAPDQTSIAWHRASSRFETLTDLGFLSKTQDNNDYTYEYKYRVEERTLRGAAALEKFGQSSEWIDTYLFESLLDERSSEPLSEGRLLRHLPKVLTSLQGPTAPVPIVALAVGLGIEFTRHGEAFAFGEIKESLRDLARTRPEIAKLSRGTTLESEGLISFNVTHLEGARPDE